MVNFGYPYIEIVICKDSTDYLGFDIDTCVFSIDTCVSTLDDTKSIQSSDIIVFT